MISTIQGICVALWYTCLPNYCIKLRVLISAEMYGCSFGNLKMSEDIKFSAFFVFVVSETMQHIYDLLYASSVKMLFELKLPRQQYLDV